MGNLILSDKNRIKRAFMILDKDKSGFLEVAEFKKLFGENISEQLWKEMMTKVDKNKDGKIDFKEFYQLLTSDT